MTATGQPLDSDSRSIKIAERRSLVARLYLRHQKGPAIHRAILEQGHECSLQAIYRDIEALEAMWQN